MAMLDARRAVRETEMTPTYRSSIPTGRNREMRPMDVDRSSTRHWRDHAGPYYCTRCRVGAVCTSPNGWVVKRRWRERFRDCRCSVEQVRGRPDSTWIAWGRKDSDGWIPRRASPTTRRKYSSPEGCSRWDRCTALSSADTRAKPLEMGWQGSSTRCCRLSLRRSRWALENGCSSARFAVVRVNERWKTRDTRRADGWWSPSHTSDGSLRFRFHCSTSRPCKRRSRSCCRPRREDTCLPWIRRGSPRRWERGRSFDPRCSAEASPWTICVQWQDYASRSLLLLESRAFSWSLDRDRSVLVTETVDTARNPAANHCSRAELPISVDHPWEYCREVPRDNAE